jgi:hypothetical protein
MGSIRFWLRPIWWVLRYCSLYDSAQLNACTHYGRQTDWLTPFAETTHVSNAYLTFQTQNSVLLWLRRRIACDVSLRIRVHSPILHYQTSRSARRQSIDPAKYLGHSHNGLQHSKLGNNINQATGCRTVSTREFPIFSSLELSMRNSCVPC